jgi:hypothetical protein
VNDVLLVLVVAERERAILGRLGLLVQRAGRVSPSDRHAPRWAVYALRAMLDAGLDTLDDRMRELMARPEHVAALGALLDLGAPAGRNLAARRIALDLLAAWGYVPCVTRPLRPLRPLRAARRPP